MSRNSNVFLTFSKYKHMDISNSFIREIRTEEFVVKPFHAISSAVSIRTKERRSL